MKGYVMISTGQDSENKVTVRAQSNLENVSSLDRFRLLNTFCKVLEIDDIDLKFFLALRISGTSMGEDEHYED